MIHLNSSCFSSAAGQLVRFGLIVTLASGLAGCNALQKLAKDDNEQPSSGPSMTAQQWLNAWSALQGGNAPAQSNSSHQAVQAEETATAPTSSASGVSLPAEHDRRPTSNQRSGSRLRVRAVVTDEGYQAVVGWYDQQRAENCEFQRDAEGALRCLPTATTDDVYFADAACTDRVATVGEQKADYALVREGTQCTMGVRVYALAGVVETPGSLFQQSSRGECVAAASVPASGTFRVLGAEVPLTEFVAGRQGVEGTDARVKAIGLVADDGAISVTGFMDGELQTPCAWEGDRYAACVPLTTEVSTFADEACSQPLLQPGRDVCASGVTFGAARDADGCDIGYYRPGEPFQGSTVYEVTDESFQSRDVSADEASAMQLGVPVLSSDLAWGNRERLAGATSRLIPEHWTTRDGGVWFSNWYDSVLDAACRFVATGDDVWQCLPTEAGGEVLFADASCTQPITEAKPVDYCSDVTPPSFVTEQVADASGHSVLRVRRVLAARPHLATVYRQTAGGCQGEAVTSNGKHFDLSQPLPASSFVHGGSRVL
jgi:hypothetical protein